MNNDCRDEFNRFMYGDEEPTTRFDVQKEVKQHWKTWQVVWAVATKKEREACAKVCDDADKNTHPADLADRIRGRDK